MKRAALVTGSRDLELRHGPLVSDTLNRFGPMVVIHGGARGADLLAAKWCERNGVPQWRLDAPWDLFARSAGPRRNAVMTRLAADLQAQGVEVKALAFPMHGATSGKSRGTWNCIERARMDGLEVDVRVVGLGEDDRS